MRTPKTAPQNAVASNPNRLKRKMETTNSNNNTTIIINNNNCSSSGGSSSEGEEEEDGRMPLSEVVADCARRWFQDALREAKAGDVAMQVLVGQMFYHGYGGTKDLQKANYWMTKASRVRSSVWNVSNKRPGYHASDSDSESEGNL